MEVSRNERTPQKRVAIFKVTSELIHQYSALNAVRLLMIGTRELRSMSPLNGIGQHPNLIHILALPRLFNKFKMLSDSIEW